MLERDDYLDAARAAADVRARPDARRPTAACCAPGTPARRSSTPTSRTTRSCSRRCSTLYEATFEPRWFAEARALADAIIERFADPRAGGFFSTADDHEQLVARRKDLEDAPIPSGARRAAFGLLRLAALTGEARYEGHGRRRTCACCTRSRRATRRRSATCCGRSTSTCAPVREVALVGPDDGVAALAARGARAASARTSCSPAARATDGAGPAAGGPRPGRRPRGRLRLRALRLPAAGDGAGRARGVVGSVPGGWEYLGMRARYAAYALAAVFGAPAGASAADVTVDQSCYAEGNAIGVAGSGYTPSSTATLTLDGTTSAADTDPTGAFSTTLNAPFTTLKHPGAQQFTLATRDVDTGAEASTTINVAKLGVDAFPLPHNPTQRITWYFGGFPSQKAIYGHWRFGGRTRGNHRMGRPQGPCGVLTARRVRSRPAASASGTWTVQFDHNRGDHAHAAPRVIVRINVYRTFS